jgi:hypothetical protein
MAQYFPYSERYALINDAGTIKLKFLHALFWFNYVDYKIQRFLVAKFQILHFLLRNTVC